MACDPRTASRSRAAPDRPAAIQQSERSARAVRRHPFGRSVEHVRCAGEGNPESRGSSRCCSFRSIPAPSRKKRACCRRMPMHSCKECRETYGLDIAGLMCIPPFDEAPAPHFALTAKIAERNGLKLLSMGMSADFATGDPVRRDACARRLRDFRRTCKYGVASAQFIAAYPATLSGCFSRRRERCSRAKTDGGTCACGGGGASGRRVVAAQRHAEIIAAVVEIFLAHGRIAPAIDHGHDEIVADVRRRHRRASRGRLRLPDAAPSAIP